MIFKIPSWRKNCLVSNNLHFQDSGNKYFPFFLGEPKKGSTDIYKGTWDPQGSFIVKNKAEAR